MSGEFRPSSFVGDDRRETVITIETDLERQSPARPSPMSGDTAVSSKEVCNIESDPKFPRRHTFPSGIRRQFTDTLKKISTTKTFPSIPQKWKPAAYDPNSESIQRLDYHPNGYPRLAAFINSDENFMMCRRFGFLHLRVLLYRQDELRELEDQLVQLDRADFEENPKILKSRLLDDSRQNADRKYLIKEIDDKLKEYDELVIRCKEFASLKRTTNRNYDSLKAWMTNIKPLSLEESEFIDCEEDFIALAEAPDGGWFDGFIEDVLEKVPCKFTRLLFTSASQRRKSDDPNIAYYSKARIDTLVRLLVCVVSVAILMVPVTLLYFSNLNERTAMKVIIILLFTLVFCVALSVFTKARRHDVLAATAAAYNSNESMALWCPFRGPGAWSLDKFV